MGNSLEEACTALEAAIPAHGFGLLTVHDLGETLRHKGIAFAENCRPVSLNRCTRPQWTPPTT